MTKPNNIFFWPEVLEEVKKYWDYHEIEDYNPISKWLHVSKFYKYKDDIYVVDFSFTHEPDYQWKQS
jgi:hypothetical protein